MLITSNTTGLSNHSPCTLDFFTKVNPFSVLYMYTPDQTFLKINKVTSAEFDNIYWNDKKVQNKWELFLEFHWSFYWLMIQK